ncbi:hypothetical protein N2152v2_003752 [Parachlorella kessleri]
MGPAGPRNESRGRGEVAEINNSLEQLSTLSGSRPDVVQMKRECFQKLIRYMTQGIDMSAAFVPATKCAALSKFDLPLKKMLYLYLRTAAKQNAAVALLVVQTLLNDCKDLDPTIRGLALRSICSLRVPDLMDSVFAAVDAGLRDPHPYVREAAVMGVLKCYQMDAAAVRLRGFLERIETLLTHDEDPQVVTNCLYALDQVGLLDGLISRALVVHLLNHIRSFSDWAQCLVLDIVTRYAPATEAERFDMLEVLDFGLNSTNSAVVMATAKLFLHYTLNFPQQHQQVLETLKDPIQTLVLGREAEVVYAVLSNFLVLAQRYPVMFSQLYPDFFCRYEDPSYLKQLKIEVLIAIADATNAYEIAEEMTQYVKDVDEDLARDAIRAVGQIALKVPDVEGILDRLLLFLGYEKDYVTAETLIQMTNVLRRYPDAADACVDSVAALNAEGITEPAARAAYVWIIGEYGQQVQESPYVLENLADGFTSEEPEVKLALLTAAAKLFFKRPPECRAALGAALAAGAADGNQDVHDRALMYYRLLQHSPSEAAAVVSAPRPPMTQFADTLSAETQDRIFDELNTLSVVHRAPASTFIDAEAAAERYDNDSIELEPPSAKLEAEAAGPAASQTTGLLDLESNGPSPEPLAPAAAAAAAALPPGVGGGGAAGDLLSLDAGLAGLSAGAAPPPAAAAGGIAAPSPSPLDLLGDLMGGGGSSTTAAPAAPTVPPAAAGGAGQLGGLADLLGGGAGAAPAAAASSVALLPRPQITPQEFQQLWVAWNPLAKSFQQGLSAASTTAIAANGHRDFIAHIAQANVVSFATPREGGPPPYRFLFHAQRSGTGSHILAQVTITTGANQAAVIVKSDDTAAADCVLEALRNCLVSF